MPSKERNTIDRMLQDLEDSTRKKLNSKTKKRLRIKFNWSWIVLKESKRLRTLCKLKLKEMQESYKRIWNAQRQSMQKERSIKVE